MVFWGKGRGKETEWIHVSGEDAEESSRQEAEQAVDTAREFSASETAEAESTVREAAVDEDSVEKIAETEAFVDADHAEDAAMTETFAEEDSAEEAFAEEAASAETSPEESPADDTMAENTAPEELTSQEEDMPEVQPMATEGPDVSVEDFVHLLIRKKITVSTAESITGGLIAAEITSVPGASQILKLSYVAYSNKGKRKALGVRKDTIRKYGSISEACAREMVLGAMLGADSDIAISVTGNAGPEVQEEKPVGLVYIGTLVKGKTRVKELHLHGSRREIREQVVKEAIRMAMAQVTERYASED